MSTEDVLLGGEESGGIAFGTHIPERDGIWAGMMILQWMFDSKKRLKELINEVYSITEPFACDRQDVELNKNIRTKVIEMCSNDSFSAFGSFNVVRIENLDGFKFHFGDNRWLLIRPSGTEPILRLYAEAENIEMVRDILGAASDVIRNL